MAPAHTVAFSKPKTHFSRNAGTLASVGTRLPRYPLRSPWKKPSDLHAVPALPLTDCPLEAPEDAGFTYCTPIQDATLPLALAGHDIASQAQTGTGKTAAFLLSTLHYLMTTPVEDGLSGPWAIMLAPTRELALQIHKDARIPRPLHRSEVRRRLRRHRL